MPEYSFPESLRDPAIKKKQIIITCSLNREDKEMIEQLAERYGTSKSDIVRTAVRHLHADLWSGKTPGSYVGARTENQ